MAVYSDELLSLPAHPADPMSTQANDAAESRPTRELPPLPYSHGTTPSSRPSSGVRDISSPTKSSRPSRKPEQAREVNRPRLAKSRISDDEKRLVGDFSTPADAVALPDPRSWMTGTTFGQATMNKKPGSSSSFRPVNTISDVNTAGSSRQITYSKQHRPYPPTIGQARHPGQLAFLARERNRVPTTPVRNGSSREEHAQPRGDASSAKRRKTQHIIDLDDDDDNDAYEVQAVGPPSAPYTPAGTSFDVPLSAKSSQSQPSVESGSTMTRSQQPSPYKSEFRATDALLNSRRKKSRTPGSNRSQGTQRISPVSGDSLSSSVNTHVPIVVHEDEIIGRDQSARRIMFQNFKQGESARSSEERQRSSRKHGTITSHHFPNARINESTSEQTVNNRQTTRDAIELRKQYQPAPTNSVDVDSSEDELAMSNTNDSVGARIKMPSKARQAANSGMKRKVQRKEARDSWPLVFARTHGYQRYGSVTEDGRAELSLRRDTGGWRVIAFNQTEGVFNTEVQIRARDVIRAQADDVSRIRLEGSRQQNGNTPIFDLEFAEPTDLRHFRDEHAAPLTSTRRAFVRLETTMATLFGKPLPKNDKLNTSESGHDPIPEAHNQDEEENKTSKIPLWNQLRSSTRGSNINTTTNETPNETTSPMTRPTTLRTSTRPTRSTRASKPSYELEAETEHPTVEKFSIDVGLGTRWNKPLQYGQGRQRAVVHFDDLSRLDEEEFMNDSLIDFYMIFLFDKLHVPSDKVYFFNTYFFTQLTRDTGRQRMNYKAVERWTSKIDIFSYDYIVVPINEATHWYLAIICNVSNIPRKPVDEDDFDNDLAEAMERSRKDLANQTNQIAEVPQQDESPSPSNNAKEDNSEQNNDDPNLFEEESMLNLVDREDPGAEVDQTLSLPQSVAAKTAQAAQVASEGGLMIKGILSSLIPASPEKKKAKRKFTQPKKDPNQPIILILDSLGVVRSGTVRALKDWLAAEGKAKRGMEAIIKENGYYPKASQIPMQSNYTDCGVYLLGYVEKFFQDPDEFKNKLLTGEMSADEDWPELKPRDMRNNMREIIFKIAEEQKVARKEEKKAKKGGSKTKTSPGPVKDDTKSETKAPHSEQVSTGKPEIGLTEAAGYQTTTAETCELEVQSPTELPKPRLASPFNFDSRSVEVVTRSKSPRVDGTLSEAPTVSTSPGIYADATPRTNRTPKRKSPEVRIPIKTPQSAASTRNGQMTSHGMTHRTELVDPGGRASSPSMSPSKRLRQDEDDGQLKLPVAKRQHRASAQQQERNHAERSSPLRRSREGSAGQPITIDDSQEVKPVASQSPKYQQTGLSAKRRTPARSPHRPKVLHHSPSVEEIPRPTSRVEPNYGRGKERLDGQGLEAKVNNADGVKNRVRGLSTRSPTTPAKKTRKAKAVSETIDADLYVVEAMETGESTSDAVVRETPEAMRSSPHPKTDG